MKIFKQMLLKSYLISLIISSFTCDTVKHLPVDTNFTLITSPGLDITQSSIIF